MRRFCVCTAQREAEGAERALFIGNGQCVLKEDNGAAEESYGSSDTYQSLQAELVWLLEDQQRLNARIADIRNAQISLLAAEARKCHASVVSMTSVVPMTSVVQGPCVDVQEIDVMMVNCQLVRTNGLEKTEDVQSSNNTSQMASSYLITPLIRDERETSEVFNEPDVLSDSILAQYQFVQTEVISFPIPQINPKSKSQLGVLKPIDEKRSEASIVSGKVRLINAGLIPTVTSTIEPKCAIKKVDFMPPQNFSHRFVEDRKMLLSYVHPNILRYVDVEVKAEGEKTYAYFLSEFINCTSLDVWLSKFERSLPQQMAANFARVVGAQMLLGLCYVHNVRDTYHGNIQPSNILLDDEGQVVLGDYGLARELLGVAKDGGKITKKIDDVQNVARVMYCIASFEPWSKVASLTFKDLVDRSVAHPSLLALIRSMLNGTKYTAIESLVDPCMILMLYPSETVAFERPKFVDGALKGMEDALGRQSTFIEELIRWKEIEGHESLSEEQREQIRRAFCQRHAYMTHGAASYIKGTLVPMLHHRKAVASSNSEWTVLQKLAENVDCVQFGEGIRTRFKLAKDMEIGVVKILELKEDEALAHALRRAVTILERSHHPNVMRMLAATRQGSMVHILSELCDLGSLSQFIGSLPDSQIVLLLTGVACQVLSALLFLHCKLNVAHREVTADHILLCSDGRVKLCGFGATGKVGPSATADMKQLAGTLTDLLEKRPNVEDTQDLRELISHIASSDPHTALKHRVLSKFYIETFAEKDEGSQLLVSLKELGIHGKNAVDEMKSWRAYDEANPTGEHRHAVRAKMKELVLRRELAAVTVVKGVVQYGADKIGTNRSSQKSAGK